MTPDPTTRRLAPDVYAVTTPGRWTSAEVAEWVGGYDMWWTWDRPGLIRGRRMPDRGGVVWVVWSVSEEVGVGRP